MKPECTTRSGFAVLTLIDIKPAIYILVTGSCTALLILIIEILLDRYLKRTNVLSNSKMPFN